MNNYHLAYKSNKTERFKKDLEILEKMVQSDLHTALCSLPGTSDERFLDYFYFTQTNKPNSEIEYIQITDNLDRSIEKQIASSKKKIVLILPYLGRRIEQEGPIVGELIQKFSKDKLQLIVKLSYKLYTEPQKYLSISGAISNVLTRMPLDLEGTLEEIENRKLIHGWEIPAKYHRQIHTLSGGFSRLNKRLCQIINNYGELPGSKDLLLEPAILVVLEDLYQAYIALAPALRKRMGLVNSKGAALGGLLQKYLESKEVPQEIELPKKLRTLFNLFYENRGEIVTNEQIDDVLRGKFDSSLWANYKLVSRLKKYIAHRYEITSLKGKGYVLREK